MTRRVVFYELNEVPLAVLRRYADRNPASGFARLLGEGASYETLTPDQGHLSPWITWPSLHRGVGNQMHAITDFGQDLTQLNRQYPSYLSILAQHGWRVGVFGSLHTFPLPPDVDRYSFYVPDSFADGPDTHPTIYQSFQSLNLTMTRGNSRNVSRRLPWRAGLSLLKDGHRLGLTRRTLGRLAWQVTSELLDRSKAVRRRTAQAQISFDLFFKALVREQPDLATFFSNHVASALHRYWPAAFPDDYATFTMPEAWRSTYGNEIWYAMDEADHHVRRLLEVVDGCADCMLVVGGSMGQAAVEAATRVDNELLLGDPAALMAALGLAAGQWQRKFAMAPQHVFTFGSDQDLRRFVDGLARLRVRGESIAVTEIGGGAVSTTIGWSNFREESESVLLDGEPVAPRTLGLAIVRIQDESGAYAYHVPEGALLVYGGAKGGCAAHERIETTRIAPSLLAHFDIERPAYMQEPLALF